MARTNEPVEALRHVLAELDRLGVRYFLGGSIASSFHGAARSTLDADLVAELDETTARRLVEAVEVDYYVSEDAALDAVRRRSCFNLVHLATSFKVDVFVSRGRAFDVQAQARAINGFLGDQEPIVTRIASAEDTMLSKLEWYRFGNEVSERQWNDVRLVAMLQKSLLDQEYLRHWAGELGVADLLDRLWSEIEDDDVI